MDLDAAHQGGGQFGVRARRHPLLEGDQEVQPRRRAVHHRAAGLTTPADWNRGGDLRRAAADDGTFHHTFFKAVAVNPGAPGPLGWAPRRPGPRPGQTSRRAVAQRVSSCRFDSWSFLSTAETWDSTVFTEMKSCLAISLYA